MQIVQVPLITWTGKQSGEWSTNVIAGAKNWQDPTGAAADYSDNLLGSAVTFDDTATGTTTINVSAANVSPENVTFNNNNKNYTLSGAFGVTGITSLTKSGSGMLTISNANTYQGATTISGGTLLFVDGGSVTSPIVNNSALVYNVTASQTAGYGISGTGTLTKTGAGTLAMSGVGSFSGPTLVGQGSLQLTGGLANSVVTIASGANLDVNGSATATIGALADGAARAAR